MKIKQINFFRYFVAIGLIATLTLFGASCSSTPSTTPVYTTPTSTVTLYQNNTYGYSIEVLPKWALNSTDDSSVVMGSPDTLDYVHISCSKTNGANLTQFVAGCVKAFDAAYPKTFAQQSTSQITRSGGLPATSMIVTFIKNEVPMQAQMLITIKGNFGYCVIGAVPQVDWGTYNNSLSSLVDSLNVN